MSNLTTAMRSSGDRILPCGASSARRLSGLGLSPIGRRCESMVGPR
jgi:hypothetical protein